MSEQNSTPNPAGGSVPLAGSERPAAAGIQATHGPVDPSRRIEVTVILRRQEQLTQMPAEPMSRAELAARHGASSGDLRLATDTFTRLGAESLKQTRPPAGCGWPELSNS
jgi:kumamolisin